MTPPPIGSFIRPVPTAMYCYQVIKGIQEDEEGPECIYCKRFGYDPKTQRPVKDGRQDIHYLYGLKQVFDGVWKEEWNVKKPSGHAYRYTGGRCTSMTSSAPATRRRLSYRFSEEAT